MSLPYGKNCLVSNQAGSECRQTVPKSRSSGSELVPIMVHLKLSDGRSWWRPVVATS